MNRRQAEKAVAAERKKAEQEEKARKATQKIAERAQQVAQSQRKREISSNREVLGELDVNQEQNGIRKRQRTEKGRELDYRYC